MMDASALLALKNACNGAVATSDRVRDLSQEVGAISDAAAVTDSDLDTFHQVALAHANAANALRGLIEEIRRKAATS
ncbi:MAG TPA: hypothetical protein VES67_00115 [Vicinamibacterales bacterium]|nr:hypothetical protein [Vicinamibacterales bacterium]